MSKETQTAEMNLQAFVKNTLTDIAQAIHGAQPIVEALGTTISPMGTYSDTLNDETIGKTRTETHHEYQKVLVDFDIAVTSVNSDGISTKIGVFLPYVGLGQNKSADLQNTQLSRIKFSVPVVFFPRPVRLP